MEGPRPVERDEWESLKRLTGAVFRPTLTDQYPQLFNEDNRENLIVIVEDGECVTHCGMIERWATILGCTVKVCCIGAVCTLPEYRGRGLASAAFEYCIGKAYQDGVDLMLVSGNRDLYRRQGCLVVGTDRTFSLSIDASDSVPQLSGVTIDRVVDAIDPADLSACYHNESVRFVRIPDDWNWALETRWVMDRPSQFYRVCFGNRLIGYVIAQEPDGSGIVRVAEYAGSRVGVLVSLPLILSDLKGQRIDWTVLRCDSVFRSLCESVGLEGQPTPTHYTLKVINYQQFMNRMRPYFEERVGRRTAMALDFWQQGDRYGIRVGRDQWVTDRDTMTRTLFGTVSGEESGLLPSEGSVRSFLEQVTPMPTLWYGINFV